MLTNEQLARIKNLVPIWRDLMPDASISGPIAAGVLLDLVEHIEQVTTHNRVMQAALAQFSDAGNWEQAVYDRDWYAWTPDTSPQHLAEVALLNTGEVSVQPSD